MKPQEKIIFWCVIGIILSLLVAKVNAQTISIAPQSMKLWGTTPSLASLAIEYKDIGIIAVYPTQEKVDKHNKPLTSNIALYWKILNASDIIKVGGSVFLNRFPTQSGQRFNFIIELGYTFNNIRISYTHISNGYLNPREFNPGLDLIQIGFKL